MATRTAVDMMTGLPAEQPATGARRTALSSDPFSAAPAPAAVASPAGSPDLVNGPTRIPPTARPTDPTDFYTPNPQPELQLDAIAIPPGWGQPTSPAAPTPVTPVAPQSPQSPAIPIGNAYDYPMWNRLAASYKQIIGHDAPQEWVTGWGRNIDEQYYNTILNALRQTDEAQAWAQHQAQPVAPTPAAPTAPTGGGGGQTNWATADYGNPETLKAYARSRGAEMSDDEANYWIGKWNSPEFQNRNYFFSKLSHAELFGYPNTTGQTPGMPPGSPTPTDPNSTLYDSVIAQFLHNNAITPYSQALRDKIDQIMQGGQFDQALVDKRIIGAREGAAGAFQGQLADARNALAAQGLLSAPGVQQGSEADTISRIAQGTSGDLSNTISGVVNNEVQASDARMMQAFQLATGLAQSDAQNILQAIGTGTNRQQMFANIALQTLSENRQWNEFLATQGLNRDMLANQVQSGQIDQMIKLLQLFMEGANTAAGGTTPPVK